MHASRRTEIDVAEAGDLCGVIGLDNVLGDTYVADGYSVALESVVVAEPVLQLSIEPQGREDSDRLVKALERFRRQDPTFRYWTDAESGQMLIAGMGQLHLDVYIQRLRDDHNCEVHVGRPQVAYKERPTRAVPFWIRKPILSFAMKFPAVAFRGRTFRRFAQELSSHCRQACSVTTQLSVFA